MKKQKLVVAVSAALMLSSVNFAASAAVQDDFANPVTVEEGAGVEIVSDEAPSEDSRIVLVATLESLDKDSASYLPLNIIAQITPDHIAVIPAAAMAGFSADQIARLTPEAVGALSVDQVKEIQPEAMAGFTAEQIAELALDAVSALSAEQVSNLTEEAVGGFTVEQVNKLTVAALAGLTVDNMGGLSGEVINTLGLALLAKLDMQVFLKLSPGNIVWFFVNLDAATVKPDQVLAYLPPGWSIHPVTGKLKIPPGKLKLKKHKHKMMLPIGLVLPELPDLGTDLSLGGEPSAEAGESSILDEIKQLLASIGFDGFDVTVTDEGILKVSGQGMEMNFIVDMDDVEQVTGDVDGDGVDDGNGDESAPQISEDEDQNYKLVTASGLKITLLTAPKNPVQLLNLVPGGQVKFDKKGNVKIKAPSLGKVLVGTFDPVVLAAPEGSQPGITLTGTPGEDEKAVVVYEDGTMQIMYPSVTDTTEVFWSAQFYGTGKLKFKADGKMTYMGPDGMLWLVVPSFNVLPIVSVAPLQPYYVWLSKPNQMLFIDQEGQGQTFYWKPLGMVSITGF